MIGLATHIVSSKGLGLPDTIKDNFRLLFEAKFIPKELAGKMEAMVGFRNIAVHDYQSINEDTLKSILVKNLPDLEEFYTTVLKYLGWHKRQ